MSIQFEVSDTQVRVTVVDIDHATVDEFTRQLADGLERYEAAPRPDPGRCTSSMDVDLSEVELLDSSGIRALIDADIAATRFGGRVVVTGARGIVRRCLAITGVLDHLQHPADAGVGR